MVNATLWEKRENSSRFNRYFTFFYFPGFFFRVKRVALIPIHSV